MILQTKTADLLNKPDNAVYLKDRSLKGAGSRQDSFMKILERNSVSGRLAEVNTTDSTRKTADAMQKPVRFKSFREAGSTIQKTAVDRQIIGKEQGSKGKDTNEDDKEAISESQVLFEAAAQTISLLMGIVEDKAKILLQESGVSPEVSADAAGCKTIAENLGRSLGLTEEESDGLKVIMESVLGELNNLTSKSDKAEQVLLSDSSLPDTLVSTRSNQSLPAADLAEIRACIDKLKAALFDAEQVKNAAAAAVEVVITKLKPELMTVNNEYQKEAEEIPLEQTASQEAAQPEKEMAHAGSKTERDEKENSNSKDMSKDESYLEVARGKDSASKGADFDIKASSREGPMVISQTVEGTAQIRSEEAVSIKNAPVVPKQEILNQVVEKAKVILSGEKSEMLIDLKPDHLGKLSMKVVTERGIVMASFVAENQQVKEVLESNLQLLRESLEKQGLSVQGFSVSVGQHSQQGSNENPGRKAYSNRIAGAYSNDGIKTLPEKLSAAAGAYGMNGSIINLTA